MTGTARDALTEFVSQLQRLRQLAGSPSLRRLAELTAGMDRRLPRSTISNKLNAESLPEWDFVVSFTTACRLHAEQSHLPLPDDVVDLAWWDAQHWRMLRALDRDYAQQRLTTAAKTEIGRRQNGDTAAPGAWQGMKDGQHLRVVARQLPVDVAGFTGRHELLATLDAVRGKGSQLSTVVISAVCGTAGVGKTALAVHWARRVADQFPDGQLYVNLRGFDPTASPTSPAAVVRGFLDAFAVPAEMVPVELDAQAALYRSLLADKQVLVVLDNARDAAQVQSLLPAAPGCLAVVTSRDQLTGLIAANGAHPLTVDLLTVEEARQLLTNRLGAQRVNAEPRAVEQLIAWTARLPLALAIVAARAATHPHFPLASLAAELADRRYRLDALDTGEPVTTIRAVFAWSYHTLNPATARLFRLLGLHPGPDVSALAAASLAGLSPHHVRPQLCELARAHLIEEYTPGRYTQHDLLRVYATEQAHSVENDTDRQEATHRLLDHYLHTAHAGARLLDPHRDPITLTAPQHGVTPEHLAGHDQAMAWFTAEHQVLLAAIDYAVTTNFDNHVWQLAWSLRTVLYQLGHWHELAATWRAAVAAADRLADPPVQALAHLLLGKAHIDLRHYDDARAELERAFGWYRQTGDLVGQAHIHRALSAVWARDKPDDREHLHHALHHAQLALDLYRDVDHRHGQAEALNAIGWFHTLLGDHHHAFTPCQQALTLYQDLGDHHGQSNAWDSLGHAHHHLGHYQQAIRSYENAVHLSRETGDRCLQADILDHLGDSHRATDNLTAAHDAWCQALTIYRDLDHPDAEHIYTKLTALNTTNHTG